MMAWRAALVLLLALAVAPAAAQASESREMRLVGQHDPLARSAGQPLIATQGDRFIVTDPARLALLTTVVAELGETHKSWWDCPSGVGYLVSDGRPQGWRTSRANTGLHILELTGAARAIATLP